MSQGLTIAYVLQSLYVLDFVIFGILAFVLYLFYKSNLK